MEKLGVEVLFGKGSGHVQHINLEGFRGAVFCTKERLLV